MRRRVKRDLVLLAGIVIVIGAIAAVNFMFVNQWDFDEYWQIRLEAEAKVKGQGLELIDWEEIQKTEGSLSRGGKFSEYLKKWDGLYVDIMGFTTPINEFRNAKEFILLPVPIECYFCKIPPAKDIIIVQMAEGTVLESMYKTPVLMHGKLTLHGEPGSEYFYSITEAKLGAGDYEKRRYNEEHMTVHEEQKEEQLLAPMEAPTGAGSN